METVRFNAFNVVSVQTESYLDLKKSGMIQIIKGLLNK